MYGREIAATIPRSWDALLTWGENRFMTRHGPVAVVPSLGDAEIGELRDLLEAIEPPLQPLEIDALDGFLAGVVVQWPPPREHEWLPLIADADRRALPPHFNSARLHALVRQRHAEIESAVAQRRWFDPWVLEPDDGAASASDAVLAWVAGFATALENFPDLAERNDAQVIEALALVYRYLDPDDLTDADDLLAVIELMEPPTDIAHAVEDLVQATLLLADVTRPLSKLIRTEVAPRRIRGVHRSKTPHRG